MGFVDETAKLLDVTNFKNKTFCYFSFDSGIVIEGYKKINEVSSSKFNILCENNKQYGIQ